MPNVLPYYEHTIHEVTMEIEKQIVLQTSSTKEVILANETILQEAQRLVHGNRQSDYGHPLDDYTKTADFWSVVLREKLKLGAKISPEEATLMMVCLKISREMNKHKRDNLTDGAGYFETTSMIHQEREKRNAGANQSSDAGTTRTEGYGCGCNNSSNSRFER